MAYLKRVARSPFWYIRFRDLDTGEWKQENLHLRHDDSKQSAKAIKEVAKRSNAESLVSPTSGERFAEWVPGYIANHYSNDATKKRSVFFWENLSVWMREKNIRHPRELKYEHVNQYIEWRKGLGASHNTARAEIKFLSFLLSEAIRREFLDRNVVALARIERVTPKEKIELTDGDIEFLRDEFSKKRKKWMAVAFEIMIHLGCRFNESRISKDRVDFDSGTIQIEDSKRKPGDLRKFFTSPMGLQLTAYLKGIEWQDGFTLPVLGKRELIDFNDVLKKRGATSHCCRVSFISRCHRAGLSESEAMRLVNHSTRMVHRIYSRLNVKDATTSRLRVPEPPPPLPKKA